ncbi:type I polyketide synthase, partial [Parafrankia sp. FMc2]|uniref:type I polyketide synthase n=1 Tax=Parafrankia sp. FMc2 TaxID=3233196 RepID=UPI0034D59690
EQVRRPVRFADAVAAMVEQGVTRFLEIGPDAALTPAIHAITDGAGTAAGTDVETDGSGGAGVLAVAAARRDRDEATTLLTAVARLFAGGTPVDWARLFDGTEAIQVPLPTYAFQHLQLWPRLRAAVSGNPAGLGLVAAEHPLLGATVALADGDGTVLTGRLALDGQRWLADHRVLGSTLVPGTAFLEIALAAGERVGAPAVDELLLHAPLVLPDRGGVRLQVTVATPGPDGRRELAVYSQPEDGDDEPWTVHATGTLLPPGTQPAGAPTAAGGLVAWPPAGATELALDGFYPGLAGAGLDYGPAFQGLRRAWARDGEVFAEVEVDEPVDGFAIHPALFDAALHAIAAGGLLPVDDEVRVPFAFTGVSVSGAPGATLRVRIAAVSGSDRVRVSIADGSGLPVAEVTGLALRAVTTGQLAANAASRLLYGVDWTPAPAGTAPAAESAEHGVAVPLGSPVPAGTALAVVDCTAQHWFADGTAEPASVAETSDGPAGTGLSPEDARGRVTALLTTIQDWLADREQPRGRLVVVTAGAVDAAPGDTVPGVVDAGLWGLVRTAQSEHPGRFQLVDVDQAGRGLLARVVGSGAPQAVIRGDEVLVPRLVRLPAPEAPGTGTGTDAGGGSAGPDGVFGAGTVVVTGGTGALGGLVARHLVAAHAVSDLLLVSRRGAAAPGAGDLVAELVEAGARVRVAACDAADPEAVRELLAGEPVSGVVHAAGVVDDGLVGSLSAERVEGVLRAKVDAVLNLHAATAARNLAAFVVFSSAAGVLGNAGQAAYAAANTFVDGFAGWLRGRGVNAVSVAFGLWDTAGGMGGSLGESERAQLRQGGVVPLNAEQGLAAFDAALSSGRGLVAPLGLDFSVLRAAAGSGLLPPLLEDLVLPATRPAGGGGSALGRQLAALPAEERRRAVLDLVRGQVAAVLGYRGGGDLDPQRAFNELGFDSMTAVELRNRLIAATGLRLPSTLVFDYPNVEVLASFVGAELAGSTPAPVVPVASAAGSDEPIAIVGMACRYPGGVASPDELWDLLATGRDAVGSFPLDRGWDVDGLYHPDPDHPGTSYTREGGFLHGAAEFDPGLFGISPREAVAMDPQHRLLLEASWEAFERAGLDPLGLRGSRTGVFAGVMYTDYAAVLERAEAVEGFLGAGGSVASGRVSYTFGLEGPAVTVDTACSSSLVALHLAVQALRGGECDLALAGGVTVMSTPNTFVGFSRQRGLSADGRCKSFSEAADGVGWGEGVGMLLVERLSDARRNGHRVLAVVRGSAVNQDGASNGLTAPNGPSQQRVIRQALANARLGVTDVDVVEGHGTGTTLGDPIEAQALLATYGQGRPEGQPLWLGSVKSNIGHAQAAAGVAGVIKMVLAMRREIMPRTLHVDAPSSQVDWDAGAVSLLVEPRRWETNGRPRRAAVSSFGISGTNAHVILEQGDVVPGPGAATGLPVVPVVPVVLSAADPAALAGQAERLRVALGTGSGLDLVDVGWSLAGRARLRHRAVLLAADGAALDGALSALCAPEDVPPAGTAAVVGKVRQGRLGVVFTGQGAQRLGMGRGLYEAFPVFAVAFDEVCELLDGYVDVPVREVVFGADGEVLGVTGRAQPALFAVEVALLALVRSWGVVPGVVA